MAAHDGSLALEGDRTRDRQSTLGAIPGRDNLFEDRGQPDFSEVAEGALWLASERAGLVTGLALPMDAGWMVKRGG